MRTPRQPEIGEAFLLPVMHSGNSSGNSSLLFISGLRRLVSTASLIFLSSICVRYRWRTLTWRLKGVHWYVAKFGVLRNFLMDRRLGSAMPYGARLIAFLTVSPSLPSICLHNLCFAWGRPCPANTFSSMHVSLHRSACSAYLYTFFLHRPPSTSVKYERDLRSGVLIYWRAELC